jgi:hypothetical protein
MDAAAHTHADRLAQAREFLREAVFESRARQAAAVSLSAAAAAGAQGCGLGERASVVLELSDRGAELLAKLHPGALPATLAARLRSAMTEWIERQDALDRKQNHFLKDFRQRQGFDRTRYDADVARAFEEGLARLHADEDRARDAAAQHVLDALGDD